MSHKSIQKTERPDGWMKKPNPGEANYELKFNIWKLKLQLWLNFIYKD